MTARHSIFFALLMTLALVGCTRGEDQTITVAIPKGYAAPTAIPKDTWEEHMKQIMAHGLEAEAVAAEPSSNQAAAAPSPRPTETVATRTLHARRTITFKSSHAARKGHGRRAGRSGRGRHGRHR